MGYKRVRPSKAGADEVETVSATACSGRRKGGVTGRAWRPSTTEDDQWIRSIATAAAAATLLAGDRLRRRTARPRPAPGRSGPSRQHQPGRGAHLRRQHGSTDNWYDYDIVTEAVLAVLAAKPDSAVGVLTDGTVPLTAFIPNDRAFQVLARDLTSSWTRSETKVFTALVDAVGRRRHRAGAALPRRPRRDDHASRRGQGQRRGAHHGPGRHHQRRRVYSRGSRWSS